MPSADVGRTRRPRGLQPRYRASGKGLLDRGRRPAAWPVVLQMQCGEDDPGDGREARRRRLYSATEKGEMPRTPTQSVATGMSESEKSKARLDQRMPWVT